MTRRIALGVALGVGLLIVLDAVAVRLGVAAGALPTIAGPSPWLVSRAAGLTAFVALALDVIVGLAMSTGALDRHLPRARTLELHRWLSTVALGLTAAHALALLADRAVRFDALDVLVPFASSYRAWAVGLGVLAAYAALVVHASFGWRKRLGARTWRRLHHLSFVAFAGALVHGLAAGSDRGAAGVQLLYLASATVVAGLVVVRLTSARRRGGRRARGAAARS